MEPYVSAVVDPVLIKHARTAPYKRGGWGPAEADALIAADLRANI